MPSRFGVAIDASQTQSRKSFSQKLFNLFGAFANVINVFAATYRTLGRRAFVMVAVMADQSAISAMICQRYFAVRAHDRFATGSAENETRVAATIEQNDRLFAARVRLIDSFE